MPNQIYVHDDFTSLGLDQTIASRVPPITDTGIGWYHETGDAARWARGDGTGGVKFGDVITTIRMVDSRTYCAVKARWDHAGQRNSCRVLLCDTVTTGSPRYGYAVEFDPAGTMTCMKYSNWSPTQIGSAVPVTVQPTDNVIVFQRLAGDTFQVLLNGTLVTSFSDSSYSTGKTHGIWPGPYVETTRIATLRDFQILDSVVEEQPADPVTIVEIY